MKKSKHQVGRPKKFSTPEELEQRCSEYFLECENKHRPYGICGLAVYVGLDRTTLYKYQKDYPDTYGEVIKWARACSDVIFMRSTQAVLRTYTLVVYPDCCFNMWTF